MIPKIIHYCWISGEENMTDDVKSCIESWKKNLPDYEFINWNDSNFDWNICNFTKHCRANNLYAFCSDYARLWALYNYGGIYLDTDVIVYKSFDELLKLKRILTREVFYRQNSFIESAIIGAEKGDEVLLKIMKWYETTDSLFSKDNFIPSPAIMNDVLSKDYKINTIYNINDYGKSGDDVIDVLDVDAFFNYVSDNAFAQHMFRNSWLAPNNCERLNKVKIFVFANGKINNYIPHNKIYTIVDLYGNIDNSCNDNFHDIIDISKDDFTRSHIKSYGRWCFMKWLYNHKEMIPDYVWFCDINRMLDAIYNQEIYIPLIVDNYGAIITIGVEPKINNSTSVRNLSYIKYYHPREDVNAFVDCVNEIAPEYADSLDSFLKAKSIRDFQYFIMKKEDFIEMCEMCFNVLSRFDEKRGYKNDNDVESKMIKLSNERKLNVDDIDSQIKLQSFLVECLIEVYYRYKCGIEKMSNIGDWWLDVMRKFLKI